jgi:sugar lactone lactonase YvrE
MRRTISSVLFRWAMLIAIAVTPVAQAGVVIYVSDFSGGRIVAANGTTTTTLVSGLSQPMGAAFGADGDLYVAQQSGTRIGRYTPAGKAAGNAFGTGRYYTGLAFGTDGMLYANATDNSFTTGVTERFIAATGAAVGTGLAAGDAAGFTPKFSTSYFEGLAFGPDGNLYAAAHSGGAIRIYQGSAGVSPGSLVGTLSGVDKPVGLAFGPDGKLYVTEQDLNRVSRWDGVKFSVFASGSHLSTPIGLGFGPDGDLYVSNYNGGNIVHFAGPGSAGAGTFLSTFATGVGNPGYILVVPEPTCGAACIAGLLLLKPRRQPLCGSKAG